MTSLLTQEQVDAFPNGQEISVTWDGGNGPHIYQLNRDQFGGIWACADGHRIGRLTRVGSGPGWDKVSPGGDQMIIAFGHHSRVGKDTAAELLKTMLCMSGKYPRGVRKLAFAKPLKDAAHIIHGHLGIKPGEHYERHPEERKIKVDVLGRDAVDYWIALGKAVREYAPTAWLDAAFAMGNDVDVLILTDLRFLNELEGVRARGGTCIRVERSSITERRASDHELEGVQLDAHIQNDGSLTELHNSVERLATDRGWL